MLNRRGFLPSLPNQGVSPTVVFSPFMPLMRLLFLAVFAAFLLGCSESPVWGPGVVVARAPVQGPSSRPDWSKEGFVFEALAEFEIEARVLSVKTYGGLEGEWSPLDLALGWGQMSDETVLEAMTIRQGGRWYTYEWKGRPPIPPGDIIRSSANMHMVPASAAVRKELEAIERGDVVRLRGALVAVRGANGYRWRSSTSRTDTGAGACEIVWVEKVERTSPP